MANDGRGSGSEAAFRMRVAAGFLNEAEQDLRLERWRSCVDNGQLAAENAAKAVMAIAGPVGRTHNPAPMLRRLLDGATFSDDERAFVHRVVEAAELLGPDVHARSDYGDEASGKTPWQLFDASDAKTVMALARDAVLAAEWLVSRRR